MKIESTNTAFKPVSVTITFETQAELNALAALMNYSPVCDAMDKVVKTCDMPDLIRDELRRLGATDSGVFSELTEHIRLRCQ